MLRTVLATSIVAALAVACGSKDSTPPPAAPGAGPTYSPLIANGLRAIANDCKVTKAKGSKDESHRCIGIKGVVLVTVSADKLAELSIKLRAMIFPEAKGHLGNALRPVLGNPGVEELLAKLETLKTGQSFDLAIGTAKIAVAGEGTSQLAPEYNVTIRW